MKKFLLLLCSLLLTAVGIKADVTVTWESYPGWVRNDVASIWWVGITTPGTTNDTYKMSEFQFAQETGYGAATRYACISKTGPTTSGAVLDESDVLGVSTNAVTASATEYYTYNLANEIELTGATTYYMVFLSSNEPTDGKYTVSNQRISLNTSYGTYAAGTMSSSGALQGTWTPGFKATLSTNAAYTVTYTCYSTAGAEIGSGSAEDLVGVFAAPTVAGYKFYKATTTDDAPFDLTQNITADTELKLYYMPYITSLANLSNDKAYIITNARSTWNVADEAESMTTSAFNADANSQKFAILQKQGKYYLFSVNANKFLTEANTLGDAKEVFISATENTDYPWFFKFDDSHNVNVDGAGNVLINTFSTIDAGNSNAIVEAGDFDPTAALAAIPFDLSLAIANPGFEDCAATEGNKTTGSAEDYSATGWAFQTASVPQSCGAVIAYGNGQINGAEAPTVDPDGNTGNALAISTGWSQIVAYRSAESIVLPAGTYTLLAYVYNANTAESMTSKLGFIPTEGEAKLSSSTSYPAGKWSVDYVTFTLDADTEGKFQIGGAAGNSTSTNHAKVFFDNLTLTDAEGLTAAQAKAEAANEAIRQAKIAVNAALVEGASLENPVAAPFVVNGTFNENTNGWTCTGGFQNKGTANNQQGAFTGNFWENWNGSAKENKMYQTIENVPNGIYKLNIAAFVNTLADPNESQYVFANDDKVYLTTGDPTMYEVYTKVENNTLKIGLEQTTATANWMGIDNISLVYFGAEGTIEDAKLAAPKNDWKLALADAKAVLANEDYAAVTGEEKTALEEEVTKAEPVDAEGYIAATAALKTVSKTFTDAKASYDALATANAYIVDLPYALAEKKPEAKAATNAAAATAAAEEVMAGLRAYYESNAKAENVEGAEVLAEAIVNPAAEDGVNGWTTTLGEGSGGSIGIKDGTAGKEEPWTDAAGSTAHKYFDGGNWGANAWDVSFSQDVTLGAGKYLLSAISRASADVELKLFAGEDSVITASIGAAGGVFNRGWNIHNVEFTVEKKDAVKIGVRGVTSVVHNWMSFSDFRLVCLEKAEEPAPAAEDYTDYIVNASLTNAEIGWNAAGTKVADYAEGAGVVKASNNAQFDFNQTIENLPAGQYKVTAQAAYRYSGSEADEAAAIAAGTETKFASLYATVGTKTVTSLVQNRYDGASETDYANGSGSTTVNGLFVPNSTNAVKAWFAAGQYVNEVVFNLPADGNVTIGIVKTAQPEAGDYTVIGPWTLTRLGDAEVEIPTYTISVADTQNGTVEADKAEAAEGDTVKVTVVPNDGFMVDEAYWTYGETKTEIEKPEEGNAAEFIMPAADVTITVTFKSAKTKWIPGDDATFLIANNSFETGDLTGWTVGNSSDTGVRENSNNTYKTEGCDGNYLFNTWWQGIPITQTVTGLPNGLFELKALMANSSIADGHKPNLYLLANGEHSEAFSSPNAGTFAEGSMQFYVTDGTATIGAIGGNNDGSFTDAGYFWYKVDNFRLTFIEALPDIASIEIPEGKMSNAAAEAITTAKEAGDVVALIAAVKAAKESIEAYANAKNVIGSLENPAEKTNVYTTEAKEAFDTYFATIQADINALSEKYEAGTLTDEEAKAATNPMAFGWHADNQFDDFLLSVWTINDVQASNYDTKLYINGWSTDGNVGAADYVGVPFGVPFFEYWVGDAETLSEANLAATMEGLEAGDYEVTALVRVRATNGFTAPATGITFQTNEGEAVDVCDGEQIANTNYFLKEVMAKGTVGSDGVMKIKFNVAAGNNISWLAYKNVMFTKVTADGINGLKSIDARETIYNLNGQKVQKAQKGIFIINGNKVVRK